MIEFAEWILRNHKLIRCSTFKKEKCYWEFISDKKQYTSEEIYEIYLKEINNKC